jgi:hypothetical protein
VLKAVYASLDEETAVREVTTRKRVLGGRNEIDVGQYPRMTHVLTVATNRNLNLAAALPSELANTRADAHGFLDSWIRDAAVQSMDGWACSEPSSKWTYLPGDLNTPSFRPIFGCWIPPQSTWPEFKKIINSIYRRE